MATRKVSFRFITISSVPNVDSFSRVEEGESALGPVLRSLARCTKLAVVSCQDDGYSTETHHYNVTLGRSCKGGGYNVECSGRLYIGSK